MVMYDRPIRVDFPGTIPIEGVGDIPVTWLKLDSITVTYQDELGRTQKEVRDIYAPILPASVSTPDNVRKAYEHLYTSAYGETPSDVRIMSWDEGDMWGKPTQWDNFLKASSYFSLVNTGIQKGIFTQAELSLPGIKDYITKYALDMVRGAATPTTDLAEGSPFQTELRKIRDYPEYEKRLRMMGQLPPPKAEDMELWMKEDKQRAKAMLSLFQEEEGTYGTGIEQTRATLEKLKPSYEKYKPMLEKGIIGGERLGPLSEQLGLGAVTEYERQQNLLKQYLSGEVLPYGISKEAQQYAQEYGVPIEQVGGLAQEWVANPQGEQFSGLNLAQRQGLTGIGLSMGGLRAGSTALLQEETLRKQKERQKQERWRELSLRAARPQKVTKI